MECASLELASITKLHTQVFKIPFNGELDGARYQVVRKKMKDAVLLILKENGKQIVQINCKVQGAEQFMEVVIKKLWRKQLLPADVKVERARWMKVSLHCLNFSKNVSMTFPQTPGTPLIGIPEFSTNPRTLECGVSQVLVGGGGCVPVQEKPEAVADVPTEDAGPSQAHISSQDIADALAEGAGPTSSEDLTTTGGAVHASSQDLTTTLGKGAVPTSSQDLTTTGGAVPTSFQSATLAEGAVPTSSQDLTTTCGAVPTSPQSATLAKGAAPTSSQDLTTSLERGAVPTSSQDLATSFARGAVPTSSQDLTTSFARGAVPTSSQGPQPALAALSSFED